MRMLSTSWPSSPSAPPVDRTGREGASRDGTRAVGAMALRSRSGCANIQRVSVSRSQLVHMPSNVRCNPRSGDARWASTTRIRSGMELVPARRTLRGESPSFRAPRMMEASAPMRFLPVGDFPSSPTAAETRTASSLEIAGNCFSDCRHRMSVTATGCWSWVPAAIRIWRVRWARPSATRLCSVARAANAAKGRKMARSTSPSVDDSSKTAVVNGADQEDGTAV